MTDSIDEQLPSGWAMGLIGDIIGLNGLFSDGDWVESKDQDPQGDIRLIQLADVGDGYYLDKSSRFLTSKKASELGCTALEIGDVLIARMPKPLGRACIFPGDEKRSVTVVDVCIVRTSESNMNHRWLMHTINSPQFRSCIESLQKGTTRKRISRTNLATINMPIPPLPEQHRIVAEIEKQFSRLDAGEAALRRVESNLKRYKAAVLKAACTGTLTADWRAANPDVEPASKLLDRILKERRRRWEEAELARMTAKGKPPKDDKWKAKHRLPDHDATTNADGLPESWIRTRLHPLLAVDRAGVTTGPFGSLLKKHEHQSEGIPVVGINNIRDMEFESGNWFHVTPAKAAQLQSFALEPGDIVISRSGTVGKPCVIPSSLGPARMSTNLMRVTLMNGTLDSQFFCMTLLGDPQVQRQVEELCKGSTRNFLNKTILLTLTFPLPPLEEQAAIVSEVERLLSLAAGVEAEICSGKRRANRLRQAILKVAFEGKLVEQDPTDEPASTLLVRIQAEREKLAANGKPKRSVIRRRTRKGASHA